MILRLTGQPFIDAGVAGIAALLEQEGAPAFVNPEDITHDNIAEAGRILKKLYATKIQGKRAKNGSPAAPKPLGVALLQEILPGSSWDQANTEEATRRAERIGRYIDALIEPSRSPSGEVCYISGGEAHLVPFIETVDDVVNGNKEKRLSHRLGKYADKSHIPLLTSATERPNCYPNLQHGYSISAFLALAALASPLSIEKTAKKDGTGSICLIYHSMDWRFMVETAKRNLLHIDRIVSSASINEYLHQRYKNSCRAGTWRMALSTMLYSLRHLAGSTSLQVVVWAFNASNTGGSYRGLAVSVALSELHRNRVIHRTAYREAWRCSDEVSRLIIEGKPIARASIIEGVKSNKDRLSQTVLRPGWALQRFYAERVMKMPGRLISAIERSATFLVQDKQAVNYCLYESGNKMDIKTLAGRYKLPAEVCAIFAEKPDNWKDYLKAAIVWATRANSFPASSDSVDNPSEIEMHLVEVTKRLHSKYGYKRLAHRLSVSVPNRYRSEWIRLIADGACLWEDFLYFNPLDEALIGGYHQTRVKRDYLIAYLLGCANYPISQDAEKMAEDDEDDLNKEELFTFSDEEEE